jgi:asparagine N-glycosylation enzyme membrane subunit Stt3
MKNASKHGGDILPDCDFSEGVRGKLAKIKAHRERPNLWHVVVTLFAMLYLGSFSGSLFYLAHLSGATAVVLICALVWLGAWAYLIRDLIRQAFRIAKWIVHLVTQQK